MFSNTKSFSASLALGILLTAGITTVGQQPQTSEQKQSPGVDGQQRRLGRGGRGFGRRPGPGGAFGPGVLRGINLTDDQRQQIRTFSQQNFESTKAVREELRQLGEKRSQGPLTAEDQARARALHEQMRTSMKDSENRIAGLLTAEQKTKAEELVKERKAGHKRFGGRRGGFSRPNQGNAPVQKPANSPR